MRQQMTVGERLKQARTMRHMSIGEVQQVSKVQKKYIEAIEADAFNLLPSDFYAKAFIRQYARALGEDGEKLVLLYEGKPIDEPEEEYEEKKESRIVPVEKHRSKNKKKGTNTNSFPMIVLAVLAIGILIAVFYVTIVSNSGQPVLNNSQPFSVISSSEEVSSEEESSTETEESSTESSSREEETMQVTQSNSGNKLNVEVQNVTYPINLVLKTGANIRILANGFLGTDNTGTAFGDGFIEPSKSTTIQLTKEQLNDETSFFLHLQVYDPQTNRLQQMNKKNITVSINDKELELKDVTQVSYQGAILAFTLK